MYNYHTETVITELPDNQVFVFGSNLAGLHRGGAARTAKDHFGALQGVGRGWSGQSFAIPTLNEHFQPMPLVQIQHYVDDFKIYTKNHPNQTYFITSLGCGGAGYQPKDIAPLFSGISDNVILPIRFQKYLEDSDTQTPFLRWEVLSFFCDGQLIFADSDHQNEAIKNNRALSPEEKLIVRKALLKNSNTDENHERIIQVLEQLTDSTAIQHSSNDPTVFASKLLNLIDEYQISILDVQQIWHSN